MQILKINLQTLIALILLIFSLPASAAEIDRFAGSYSGQADIVLEDESQPRDIMVTIEPLKEGFKVDWTSVIYKTDRDIKTNSYSVHFVPSQRANIFGSAMQTNVFGKKIPLDPLRAEPFVWSRLEDDTLSVFALFINDTGEYELQEHHRTLVDGGLDLLFRRVRNGEAQREITAHLKWQP